MRIYCSEKTGENCTLPPHLQTMLKQVIGAGLKFHPKYDKLNCEVNLSFVAPGEIQRLNKYYRKLDAPTDVLSFPNTGAKPVPGFRRNKPTLALGDIVICRAIAEAQAKEYGHSFEREMAFLTAHGFLHLIGYDHITPGDEEAMKEVQEKILTWVGIER